MTVDIVENCGYPGSIGNGRCDQENNNAICGEYGARPNQSRGVVVCIVLDTTGLPAPRTALYDVFGICPCSAGRAAVLLFGRERHARDVRVRSWLLFDTDSESEADTTTELQR